MSENRTEMYEEAPAWVMARHNRRHGLAPLKRAFAEIGNPHNGLNIIHVAGTNGKGSTVNFLNAMLMAHGQKTGMFTSPHLVSHLDRIRFGGKWMAPDVFYDYLQKFKTIIIREDLGMFEIDVLIALAWYKQCKADYVLLEAGLGGRLDSTNVIENPLLSIITTVDYDHTDMLGERIEQIAFEKAGILKPYGHALLGHTNEKALNVIRRRAWRRHCALTVVRGCRDTGGNGFAWDGDNYELSSRAPYQKDDAVIALEAGRMLGIDTHDAKTHRALREAVWPGRFEIFMNRPRVILDGAHNKEGTLALCRALKGEEKPVVVVFAGLRDKPLAAMAALLSEEAQALIVTGFAGARSADPASLHIPRGRVVSEYASAISQGMDMVREKGTLVITGSLYFISRARAFLQKYNDKNADSDYN